MDVKKTTKKRALDTNNDKSEELDLFPKGGLSRQGADEDEDSTDSEESVYSGLEEEEDSEDEADSDDDEDGEEDMSEDSSEDEEVEAGDEGSEAEEESGKVSTSTSPPALDNRRKKLTKTKEKIEKNRVKDKKAKFRDVPSKSQTVGGITVNVPDEYEYDSSDEEDLRNTVGNIPMEWYDEYDHIGYNLSGQKIIKPAKGDELDNFLSQMDNPDHWRTVIDKTTGQKVVLTHRDAEMIKRFTRGKYMDMSYDPYEPWIDFFTHEPMKHPITNVPASKRSFIPSKLEAQKVSKMVHAIKMGWMKPYEAKKEKDDQPKYYQLWKDDDQEVCKRYQFHIPAPKMKLPGHAESYNPPPEYLMTEEEKLAWNEEDPEDRKRNFVPQKYSSLRAVPAYNRYINERFERCLDLYLCPRLRKMRMNVDPEDLIPKLPKPRDLQPFPTTQAVVYKGHTDIVRCISVEPNGQWLVSGSDDQTIKLWEVASGRCMRTLKVGGIVRDIAWSPSTSFSLITAIVDNQVIVINPQLGDSLMISNTDNFIQSYEAPEEDSTPDKKLSDWSSYEGSEWEEGFRLKIEHFKTVGQVRWHAKGDYFAVVIPKGDSRSVIIHQLSKRRSQRPFSKNKGLVQCVLFHPLRPFLFVATQRHVRVYNLLKQSLTKKLLTNMKWVSCMAVHPGGDNLLVGSYDCKLSWFDLDLSTKPYQTLRHQQKAIRHACYHRKYPLFASAADDGTVVVCHGKVYSDLLQNPLIVPVKILRGHELAKGLGVLSCEFHPTQPWIFSSGADCTVRLFT